MHGSLAKIDNQCTNAWRLVLVSNHDIKAHFLGRKGREIHPRYSCLSYIQESKTEPIVMLRGATTMICWTWV